MLYLFNYIITNYKHEINITESGFFGYADGKYCSDTPELRQADGRDGGVALPDRRSIRLTFVPQWRAGGYSLTNETVGRLRLSTWVMRN